MQTTPVAKTPQPIVIAPPIPQVIEEQVSSAKPSEDNPTISKPVNKIGEAEKGIARSIFDSIFRGVIRYFESLINNQPLRVLYRLVSELGRKTSEIAFLNVLDKKKALSKSDLINGVLRALEHVPATTIIEPSFFEGSIPRVLAGLGNMAVRFASRYGFYKINSNSISRETLGEKNLMDEFVSRSLARVIPVNFDNPIGGISMRILEQLAIDLNLHVLKPLSKLFPQIGDFTNKSLKSEKDLVSSK